MDKVTDDLMQFSSVSLSKIQIYQATKIEKVNSVIKKEEITVAELLLLLKQLV